VDDTEIAFESPNVRSKATAGSDPLDRISVRDYEREVEIGAFQSERGVNQRIRFNVVLEVSRHNAAQDDDVDQVISYDSITEAIELQLSTERINLLETLAERVAERILNEPQAMRVFVRIEKLDRGPGALGVEIVRKRAGDVDIADDTPLHPQIVYLDNSALHSGALGGWIDIFTAQDTPVIICLGLPDAPPLQTGHPPTQRRIDLLEIEQNAWLLASKDERCVVVDSRTELDWAMKQGNLSVWAPSRIVLDAVDGPPSGSDGLALARWLAEQMDATRLVVIGQGGFDPAKPGDFA